jgi:hypothetical protein
MTGEHEAGSLRGRGRSGVQGSFRWGGCACVCCRFGGEEEPCHGYTMWKGLLVSENECRASCLTNYTMSVLLSERAILGVEVQFLRPPGRQRGRGCIYGI